MITGAREATMGDRQVIWLCQQFENTVISWSVYAPPFSCNGSRRRL